MRPALTKDISVTSFQEFYWLKKELQLFCKENDLSSSGSKSELTEQFSHYLATGEKLKPKRKKTVSAPKQTEPLTLGTIISENHRCSQNVRAFFKSVIGPHFHFSTFIQTFFKENVGKTYQDAIQAWDEEEQRKKDPSYTKEIASQFEYNRFIRDFYQDKANKGKSRSEAITAWNEVKSKPGSNRYQSNSN